MNLAQLMSTTPDSLAKTQLIALHGHVMQQLNDLVKHVKDSNWGAVREMMFYSPAGDDMGTENHCINFSYKEGEERDLMDLIEEMERLEKQLGITRRKEKK